VYEIVTLSTISGPFLQKMLENETLAMQKSQGSSLALYC